MTRNPPRLPTLTRIPRRRSGIATPPPPKRLEILQDRPQDPSPSSQTRLSARHLALKLERDNLSRILSTEEGGYPGHTGVAEGRREGGREGRRGRREWMGGWADGWESSCFVSALY